MTYFVIALLIFIVSTIIVGRYHTKFEIDIDYGESVAMVGIAIFIGSVMLPLVLFLGAVFFSFKSLLKLGAMSKKAVK